VSRVLAYCAFRYGPQISLPDVGVRAAQVQLLRQGALGLLWSEVEWPFDPARMQRSAVEFHDVIHHIFGQAAVIPFRLLSVFQDGAELAAFAAAHEESFLDDLERLRQFVQMEFVVYPAPGRMQPENSSGKAYLEQKAGMVWAIEQHVTHMRDALGALSHQVVVRETRNGHRVFVLVERGSEQAFRETVNGMGVPEGLSRRSSGPWPAAEFLSERVKTPQIAGTR
jgi:Gas vesicle synthesis protein GvpL/GvpF